MGKPVARDPPVVRTRDTPTIEKYYFSEKAGGEEANLEYVAQFLRAGDD